MHNYLAALLAIGQLEQCPALLVQHTLMSLESLTVLLLLCLPGQGLVLLQIAELRSKELNNA